MYDEEFDDDFDISNLDDRESRALHFEATLDEAVGVGASLAQPSTHFSRIFAVLQPEERRKVFEEVFKSHSSRERRVTNYLRFVEWALDHELDFNANDEIDYEPPEVPESKKERDRWFGRIINGEDFSGLARVIAATTFAATSDSEMMRQDIESLLSKSLGRHVLTSEQAAALASCVNHNELRVKAFETDADVVLADVHIYGKYVGYDEDELGSVLPLMVARSTDQVRTQSSIVRPAELCYSFELEQTPTGLFIPTRKRIVLARSLQEALLAAERDRDSLMSMSPRRFEEFMAEIFKTLGFEVELTLSTRDGGADLLCLQDVHGIPFRFAVEVKRYKPSRKIDVSLVRSFVGANKKFEANRLVYVTTSDYTQPARDYATNYARHLLTLKRYDQIKEWCRDCLNTQPRILGPNANVLP